MIWYDSVMAKMDELLRQGSYQAIVDRMRSTGSSRLLADQVALIGALSFLGRLEEALQVWQVYGKLFRLEEKVQARFFLGVALTRISKFKRARDLFKANLSDAKSTASQAYASQGAGFYSYFQGRFTKAAAWSKKALRQSVEAEETYIEYLAMDLLGHSTVQAGRRSQGLRLLRDASQLAESRGNIHFSAAFANSRLVYEAEVGLRPQTIVGELKAALGKSGAKDSYTRSNLILELARQLTLRGQLADAKNLLNREAAAIYAFDNKRQEVMLQLRLAEIAYLQHDFHLMNHLLQSARKTMVLLGDKAFEIRLLGLSLKIPRSITGDSHKKDLSRLLQISKEHSSRINRQILFREGHGPNPETPAGEDPLHDLLSLAHSEPERAQDLCLDNGYTAIYRKLAGIDPSKDFLKVLNSGFVAGSREEIVYVKMNLSSLQLKILQQLTRANADKEHLVKTVWGYEYDPLRHDSLVHNTIAKLRKTLGANAAWIVTTEQGWAWDRNVQLLMDVPKQMREPRSPEKSEGHSDFLSSELNFRQLRALRITPVDSGWSIGAYKKTFKVSTMTAFRDLTHLLEKGLVIRTGRGRACRYLLPGGNGL